MQRVFGPHQQGRRRAPSGALQRRQHFDDFGTARIQRGADLLLAAIERAQPRFGVADPGLDAAHLGGDVDQLLIELAAILADRGDVGLELRLQFRRALLLRARGFEFLLALLDGIGRSGVGLRRRRRDLGGRRRQRWMPAKPADSKAMESGMRIEHADRGGRCLGTIECSALAASIPISAL